MVKVFAIYLLLAGVPVIGIVVLLGLGQTLQAPVSPASDVSGWQGNAAAGAALMPHLNTLLLQIVVILTTARLVGGLFRKIHQPQVVGEMAAGIILGPSLLGWLAPGVYGALFPAESLGFLSALSQIGLILFMFLVGLELDLRALRGQGRTALLTSHTSIVFPFFLGALLAFTLYPRLAPGGVRFDHFALFMGAALSITAFPVLARILGERNMLQSKVGVVAIACAAIDDVTGWCILAGVVLLVRAGAGGSLWTTVLGSAAYIALMLFGARRFLSRFAVPLAGNLQNGGRGAQQLLALLLILLLLSAWVTESLGIHALFGAFLAGVVMPKEDRLVSVLAGKLEDVAVVLLLPIFFAFNGLRTSLGLLNSPEMWLTCLLIVVAAVAGKFGGSTLAARATGLTWREAGAIGVLMNTRGLMELVLLNIGLDIGVISPVLFTMLVVMALVTTFMTSPALEWVYFARVRPHAYPPASL